MRFLLDNEFQAAVEAAPENARVVLGDQRIEDLSVSAKTQFISTVRDFTTPFDGGWSRLWNDGRGPNPNDVGGVEFGGEMVGVGIFLLIAFQFFVLAFVDFPFQAR